MLGKWAESCGNWGSRNVLGYAVKAVHGTRIGQGRYLPYPVPVCSISVIRRMGLRIMLTINGITMIAHTMGSATIIPI